MPDLGHLLSQWALPLLARGPEPRTRDTALRSEVRQQILQLVEREPGIPLSRLRQRVGLGWGAFYHQLRRLEESGLVHLVHVGRRRIVVGARAAEPDRVLEARARLAPPMLREIARLIAHAHAADTSVLAARTGLSPRAVRYHLRALLDAGLVASASASRHRGLRPTSLLLAALAESGRVRALAEADAARES